MIKAIFYKSQQTRRHPLRRRPSTAGCTVPPPSPWRTLTLWDNPADSSFTCIKKKQESAGYSAIVGGSRSVSLRRFSKGPFAANRS